MPSYFRSHIVFLVLLMTAGATVVLMQTLAQTSGSGSTQASNAAPVITLSVNTANAQVSGYRPGVNAYFSVKVTDDVSLKSVVITTSPMMYSGQNLDFSSYVSGKTSWEEKVYSITPSNPGPQFVTVTATDSADQVSTKTVNFDAPACVTDADCGGTSIQWGGASYCGSLESGSYYTSIMQYGVAATCKSGGICDTASLPRVKQQCSAGQICTFDTNGNNLCIAQPSACATGAQITSVCVCGRSAFNYPGDWRVRTPTYCCINAQGETFTTSQGPCPVIATTNVEGTASVTQVFPGQYDNTKFTITVADQDGVKEFSVKNKNYLWLYSGSPGAAGNVGACTGTSPYKTLPSGTVTIAAADFPLMASITDCKDRFTTFLVNNPNGNIVIPVTATASTLSVPSVTPPGAASTSTVVVPSPVSPVQTAVSPTTVPAEHPSAASPTRNESAVNQGKIPVHHFSSGSSLSREAPVLFPSSNEKEKKLSPAGVRRETQLLKSRGKQTSAKIHSIEKKIISLEKKIDAKLRLLDRARDADVRKRVTVQIDKWQAQMDILETQKDKLDLILDDLRESFEQLKAAAE